LSQNSTLSGIATASATFDANDHLSTETYDNNGNTIVSGARSFVYDFRNHLESMNDGAVTMVYDGDGRRVAKTVGGVTTRYLVDDLNPTHLPQVVEEVVNGTVQRTYTYGLQRINEDQTLNGVWTPSFYGYDGFGSVRQLTDSTGTVTDTYSYDAWGNSFGSTGSTPNVYLYRGEQYDSDLQLYYLRARYFNPLTGRFISRDLILPRNNCNQHRYLYACSDPIGRIDPSGLANLATYGMLVRTLVIGGLGAGGAEEAGVEVEALEDYGVVELERAAGILAELSAKVGYWVQWRITIATGLVSPGKMGPFVRYIAISTEKVAEAGEEAAAATELQTAISQLGRAANEIFLPWVEGAHAEVQVAKAAAPWALRLALAASRPVCPACESVVDPVFMVWGPQ
jgi:RHS repeat-associated protein